MAVKNFNRIIDITLTQRLNLGIAGMKTGAVDHFIRCPRAGRKPDIEISGQIQPSDQVSLFEIKIKNLYDTKIVQDLTQVQVVAGYEENSSAVFTGSPINVYTNGPGPDRETVIQCTIANFGDWTGKTIKLDLKKGWTLKQAVTQINNALNFDEPAVSVKVATLTAQANWSFTGTAKEALHILTSKFFPGNTAFVMNNRITITAQDGVEFVQTHEIPFLSTAPQFSGNSVTLTAPWNPAIKPNDRVRFSSNYYTAENSLLFGSINQTTEIVVTQIGFSFGTTGQTNQMTIQGILVGGSK